jgi:hypothetical protein
MSRQTKFIKNEERNYKVLMQGRIVQCPYIYSLSCRVNTSDDSN